MLKFALEICTCRLSIPRLSQEVSKFVLMLAKNHSNILYNPCGSKLKSKRMIIIELTIGSDQPHQPRAIQLLPTECHLCCMQFSMIINHNLDLLCAKIEFIIGIGCHLNQITNKDN